MESTSAPPILIDVSHPSKINFPGGTLVHHAVIKTSDRTEYTDDFLSKEKCEEVCDAIRDSLKPIDRFDPVTVHVMVVVETK